MLNRRTFLATGSLAVASAASSQSRVQTKAAATLPQLLRQPDMVRAQINDQKEFVPLQRTGERWTATGLELSAQEGAQGLALSLHAPTTPIQRIHLRWIGRVAEDTQVLGDAWERSYGDLAWLQLQPERVLPWYFMAASGSQAAGTGVKTGAAALAFWQVDAEGVSLWLDVRNGGNGVLLGDRVLALATVVQITPQQGAWDAIRQLCSAMVAGTTVPARRGAHSLDTIYGSNDWYYAYGKNTPEGILRDADLMRELAPAEGPKPFCIIDDGYQDPSRFPSMSRLAEQIRTKGCVPGIWIRPLRAAAGKPASWMLPQQRTRDHEAVYDPTIPEACDAAMAVVREARDWGYDFLKHDFTTYELLGGWGKDFGASPTREGWNFHDRAKTNAEIIRDLYANIRTAAGDDRIILGCNTIGHLSAGIFDASRTGDDTSGKDWERTRRMGVNTLAFRMPQDRVFFRTDADCVPFTPDVPVAQTEAWLQAVSRSGSMLLISADPRSVDTRAKAAIREAFATLAARPSSEPVDWMESRTPSHWLTNGKRVNYEWLQADGASPFPA